MSDEFPTLPMNEPPELLPDADTWPAPAPFEVSSSIPPVEGTSVDSIPAAPLLPHFTEMDISTCNASFRS